MHRFVSISVIALVAAGFAIAGDVETGSGDVYVSSDGPLFGAILPEISSSLTVLSSASSIPTNTSAFAGATANATLSTAPYSTSPSVCPYSNLFGGTAATCDGGSTDDFLFTDQTGGGPYTDTLVFNTASPVTITGFNIYLAAPTNGNRTATAIDFFNMTTSTEVTANTITSTSYTAAVPSYVYSSPSADILEFSTTFSAQTGSQWEFTFTTNNVTFNGVRIWDIASTTPEPGTWMLGGLGVLGLIIGASVRNRRARSNA